MKTLLLIQARKRVDPAAAHEVDCMRRRLGQRDVALSVRHAVEDDPELAWLDGVDAIVIGGSGNYSVHHPLSLRWVTPLRRLLDVVLTREIPSVGICFGHQLLGLHLGSRVVTSSEHTEVGTVSFDLTPTGVADPVFGRLEHTFTGQTGHSDYVETTPSGLELLATNSVVENQAFRVVGMPFYTTQFHPDLTGSEARWRYLATKAKSALVQNGSSRCRSHDFTLDECGASSLLGRFLDVFVLN